MYECFYIVEVRDNWFRLHFTDTHYCLGASDNLETLLNTVKRLVKKYRTKSRLIKRLSQMEDGGKISEKTLEVYSNDYDELHYYYTGLIKSTVKEVMEEIKNDSVYNRVKKRVKPLNTKVTTAPQTTEKVMKKVSVIKPKVLKRPKVLLCK